jgi:hypothetical protein
MKILPLCFICSVKFTTKYTATIEFYLDFDTKNSEKNVLTPLYVYKFIIFLNNFVIQQTLPAAFNLVAIEMVFLWAG